ncbi:hypothetical protein UY3_08530 [Chelonia mydas]|uniref:Uncharacterized protein n=1 Tax=Chelonia mydas TaxID=8469 RepID=M7BAY6_CHEMY|nr:hypothetical protein UY3_08530 [Chelonia mydas]
MLSPAWPALPHSPRAPALIPAHLNLRPPGEAGAEGHSRGKLDVQCKPPQAKSQLASLKLEPGQEARTPLLAQGGGAREQPLAHVPAPPPPSPGKMVGPQLPIAALTTDASPTEPFARLQATCKVCHDSAAKTNNQQSFFRSIITRKETTSSSLAEVFFKDSAGTVSVLERSPIPSSARDTSVRQPVIPSDMVRAAGHRASCKGRCGCTVHGGDREDGVTMSSGEDDEVALIQFSFVFRIRQWGRLLENRDIDIIGSEKCEVALWVLTMRYGLTKLSERKYVHLKNGTSSSLQFKSSPIVLSLLSTIYCAYAGLAKL